MDRHRWPRRQRLLHPVIKPKRFRIVWNADGQRIWHKKAVSSTASKWRFLILICVRSNCHRHANQTVKSALFCGSIVYTYAIPHFSSALQISLEWKSVIIVRSSVGLFYLEFHYNVDGITCFAWVKRTPPKKEMKEEMSLRIRSPALSCTIVHHARRLALCVCL